MGFLKTFRRRAGFSERDLAQRAGISRRTLRQIEQGEGNPTISSLHALAKSMNRSYLELIVPETPASSEFSTVAVSLKVLHDGFPSWKLHFMELVDEFRKTLDPRLLVLAPATQLDLRLRALLASLVMQLCIEVSLDPPDWTKRSCFLKEPWFISETESLKASAIKESPLAFRRNNIFVTENFLSRT